MSIRNYKTSGMERLLHYLYLLSQGFINRICSIILRLIFLLNFIINSQNIIKISIIFLFLNWLVIEENDEVVYFFPVSQRNAITIGNYELHSRQFLFHSRQFL